MRQGALSLILLACALALSILGCADAAAPELLELRDIQPGVVEAGDRVEIVGTNLPTGLAKEAEVVFRGAVHRPGQAPREAQAIRIGRAAIEPDRVSFTLDETARARFCGEGDEAEHATFHGNVEVRVEGGRAGGMAVRGVLRGVAFDVHPKAPRRAVAAAREHAGRQALAHLGLGLRQEPAPGGGLEVEAVREGSPAAESGVRAGDVIVSFEGVRVFSVSDLVPSGSARKPALVVLRGRRAGEPGETLELAVSIEHLRPSPTADLLAPAILLGTPALLLFVLSTPAGRALTWLEHRLAARLGRRRKRDRGGPGRLALLADHLLGRLGVSAGRQEKGTSRLAPALVFALVSALFLAMPLSRHLVRADLDVGVTFLAAAVSLVAVAFVTGGGERRFSLLGSLRASAAVVSAELPALLATIAVVVASGSLELEDILAAQAGPGGSWLGTGAWPWYWWVCRAPASLVLFALFFTTALVDCSPPGPLPEVETRGGAGRGGGRRSLFFGFADGAHLLLLCGLASALFLGGWHLPGVGAAEQRASGMLSALGAGLFLAKSWALALAVLSARVALPPLRLPELLRVAWRLCVPLALAASLLAVAPPLLLPTRGFEEVLGPASFAAFLTLTLHFGLRLRRSLRVRPRTLALNPFL